MENILNYLEYLIMCGAHANEIIEDNFNLYNEMVIDVRGDYINYYQSTEQKAQEKGCTLYVLYSDDKTFRSERDTIFEDVNIIEYWVFYNPGKQVNKYDTMKIFGFNNDKNNHKLVLKGMSVDPDECKNLVKPSIFDIFNCVRLVNPFKAFENIWKGTKVSVLCTLNCNQKLKVDNDGTFFICAANIFFGNTLSKFFYYYKDITYFKVDKDFYSIVKKGGNGERCFIINGVLENLNIEDWDRPIGDSEKKPKWSHLIRVSKENQGFIREIDINTLNNYLTCLEGMYNVKHSGSSGLIESVNKLREKQHLQRYTYIQDIEQDRERRRIQDQAEEEERRRKEEEERRRKEEEERRRKEEEQRKQEEERRRQQQMEEERKRKEEFDRMQQRRAIEMEEMNNKRNYIINTCNNIIANINNDSLGKKNMLSRRILDYCKKVEDEKNFQVVLEMSDDFINELKMERRDVLTQPFADERLEGCFSPSIYVVREEEEEKPANNIMNNPGVVYRVDNSKEKKGAAVSITNAFNIPVPLTILEQKIWKVSLILCKAKLMRDEMAYEYADLIFSGDEWKSAENMSTELINDNGIIENYRQNVIQSIQSLLRFIVNENNKFVTLCSDFVNGYFERIFNYFDGFNNNSIAFNPEDEFDIEFRDGISNVSNELNSPTYFITPMDIYITLYHMLKREQSDSPE